MIDVLNLALPFFGLIFIGFACGKLKQIPDTALAWMNFFIVYVALPALFYRILAQTPLEQAGPGRFRLRHHVGDVCGLSRWPSPSVWRSGAAISRSRPLRGWPAATAISAIWARGWRWRRSGPPAAVPVALIFCFDTLLLFTMVPFLMALARPQTGRASARPRSNVVKRIVLHPLMIATAVGVASAAIQFQPPVALDRLMQFLQNAAAPCALFTLGVTVALRPLKENAVGGAVPHSGEARSAPGLDFPAAVAVRAVRSDLGLHRGTDGGAAAGAQRVRVRAAIRHLGRTGLQRGAGRHAGVGGHADQRDVDGENRYAAATVIPVSLMQPLSGLLVLDFTTLLPGPLASLMLAEAGAEVIKIERPGGEDMRAFSADGRRRERALRAAQSRQEEPGARSQERGRPRQADAACWNAPTF